MSLNISLQYIQKQGLYHHHNTTFILLLYWCMFAMKQVACFGEAFTHCLAPIESTRHEIVAQKGQKKVELAKRKFYSNKFVNFIQTNLHLEEALSCGLLPTMVLNQFFHTRYFADPSERCRIKRMPVT